MAEYVTTVRSGGPVGAQAARRMLEALAGRLGELGDGRTVRSASPRNASAAAGLLAAAAPRLGIVGVEQHVCQHDQGIGYCS